MSLPNPLQKVKDAKKKGKGIRLSRKETVLLSNFIETLEFCANREYHSTPERDTPPTPGFAHMNFHGYDNVEIKTIGQLFDELIIENLKIWHLVDRVKDGESTYVQRKIQEHNDIRRKLVRALDKRLGERDIGGRV